MAANRRRQREIRQIINGLRAIVSAERRLSQQLAKKYRITARQLGALRIISLTPGISLGDLSERMYLHISTCSGIIDRLEEKRLLKRDRSADDRRVMQLFVTSRGSRITKAIPMTGFGFLMKDINILRESDVHSMWIGMRGFLKLMRLEKDIAEAERAE